MLYTVQVSGSNSAIPFQLTMGAFMCIQEKDVVLCVDTQVPKKNLKT